MNTRLLGIIFMVCTLAQTLLAFRSGDYPQDALDNVGYLVWGIGGVCGIAGLIGTNALGTKTVARALGFLPMIGFAFFALGEALYLSGLTSMGTLPFTVVASIAWLALLTGMLVVGILTIAAKTWRGWRRFTPLLAIVMFPLGAAIGGLIGGTVGPLIGHIITGAFWLLLGFVITTAEPAPAGQPNISATSQPA